MKTAMTVTKGRLAKNATRVRVPDVNTSRVRARLDLTQQEFGDRFGIPVKTLRKWEQGSRQPDEAARAYLLVISRIPDAVLEALEKGYKA